MTGRDRLLVSPTVLADELAGQPAPVLLDVRWRLAGPPGLDSYREGHLPGAVFVDLDRDLAAPPGPAGRHPLPDPAAFTAAMRAAGVSQDRAVVLYDDRDATAAARGWWLLRYFGHDHVRVLDGGYQAWLAAGLPVSAADPAGLRGDFTARPGHMPVLDAAGAGSMARAGVLLDARAGERYRGEKEPVDPVAGHIPGAVSAPTAGNVNPDGTFRTAAELRARFAALGADPAASTVGAYCGSGVTAAHEVLALALAGIPAALYVGSWSNWVTDPARPVATGSLSSAQAAPAATAAAATTTTAGSASSSTSLVACSYPMTVSRARVRARQQAGGQAGPGTRAERYGQPCPQLKQTRPKSGQAGEAMS